MYLISLGSDCCVTYQLQKFHFRNCAFPFDWIRCNLEDAIRLIKNNFKDILEEVYFTRTSSNFKFTIESNEKSREVSLGYIYKSNRYPSLEFCHDFIDEYKSNLLEVRNKFSRRSSRFMEIYLKEPCSFIHYTTKPIDEHLLDLWENTISKPLYIISTIPIQSKKYKFISFVLDTSKYESWHRDHFNWLDLFNTIVKLDSNHLG